MTIDITLFRHGTTNPHYDDNGRQVDSCVWEQTHHFTCVEHSWFYNAYRNDDTQSHDTEQEKQHKLFYIEIHRQLDNINLDIKLGDYVREDNGMGYWWKVLGTSQQEILPNCWIVTLRGQRISNREFHQLGLRDEDTSMFRKTGR